MAYTPINWQTGDTITADKLNRCDNGWSVKTTSTTLPEESVTTSEQSQGTYGTLSYTTQITADTIVVTWDGTEYTCTKGTVPVGTYYGGIDPVSGPTFTEYPFCIVSTGSANMIYTESAGTYAVKIGIAETTMEISDDFATASQTAVADVLPLKIVLNETTFAEVEEALKSGRQVIYIDSENANRTYQQPVIFTTRSTTPLRVAFVMCDSSGSNLSISGFSADSVDGVLYV